MKKLIGLFTLTLFLVVACSKQDSTQPLGLQSESSSEAGATELQLADLENINTTSASSVVVPPGSQNALADAIAEAGENGTVVLASGMHYESDMVTIGHTVKILGEDGAVLEINSESDPANENLTLDVGLYIRNTSHVEISNLEIRPQHAPGGVAILIENAPHCTITRNKIYGHQFSIAVHQGNYSQIIQNTVVGDPGWTTGALGRTMGIVVMNGDKSIVSKNNVSSCLFGIFASDGKGKMTKNVMHGNWVGTILCKVPTDMTLPSGVVAGSEYACNYWTVTNNNSYGNFDAGYLIIDGANNNKFANNDGHSNGTFDVDLVGDSYRFGFFTPTSFENLAYTGDLLTKDCGLNNTVIGENLVDTSADPCF